MLNEEDFGIIFEVDNFRFPRIVAHTMILTNAERLSLKHCVIQARRNTTIID